MKRRYMAQYWGARGKPAVIYSLCPDCAEMIRRFGCTDRSCDQHWKEDNPNGIRTKFTMLDIDTDTLKALFGGRHE